MSTVGKRLRKLRKEKGLTQTEVTGGQYSKEYVSQVELGKTKPSRKAIKLFAKHLDVDESYFETGVDLAGRERFENLIANGEVLTERREYAEAIRAFEEARSIGEKAENLDFVWRAETGRAWALHQSGKRREALSMLAEARSYQEEKHPVSVDHALVLFRIASVREAMGDLKLALLLLEEAAKVLERCPVPAEALRVRVLRRMASIYAKRRDLQAGREAAEAALDLAKRLTDRRAVAEAYWEAALLEERRREFTRATEYAQRARDLLSELGDQQETAVLLNDLGEIKQRMGRASEAAQHFEEALELLRMVDDPATRSSLLNGLADARLSMGEYESSLESAGKSLAIMEGRENNRGLAAQAHLIRSRAYLQQTRLEEARKELADAKELLEKSDSGDRLGDALVVEGDLLLAEGQPEAAAMTFRRSYELAHLAQG
jgi:tetratricopeptide (TPR) repeat protein